MSIIINDKSPKTYVVLGMHKSGTSFISKALSNAGVDMGVRGETRTFENADFLKLNEEILHECNGSWDFPPECEHLDSLVDKYKKKASELIQKYKSSFWGFKDPRTVLTFPVYENLLKDDVYLVCVFRKPKKLVEKGFKPELINKYNNKIIKIIERFCEI